MKPMVHLMATIILVAITDRTSGQEYDFSKSFLKNISDSKDIVVVVEKNECPGSQYTYERAAEGAILRARINTTRSLESEDQLVLMVYIRCISAMNMSRTVLGTAFHVIAVFARSYYTDVGETGKTSVMVLGDLGNMKTFIGTTPETDDQDSIREAVGKAVEDAMTDYLKANIER